MSTVDEKLDQVTLRQTVWKNTKLLTACLLIAEKALEEPNFYADGIVFDFLLTPEDRNCIGSAFRLSIKTLGIIEKTGQFRRSTGEATNGRMVFQYRLLNRPIAQAFIKKYDIQKYLNLAHPQLSLSL